MVFVLDNYDSFTYNLVQYMGELGAEMVVRRNDADRWRANFLRDLHAARQARGA